MYDNEKLVQEEQPQEQVEQVEQQESQPEQQQESPIQKASVQASNNAIENNMRALREKAERFERERNEYYDELRAVRMSNQKKPEEEEDFSINIGVDDLAEGKHITKMQQYNQREFAKQKRDLEELKNQTKKILIESQLKSDHPDLDRVVSAQNLKTLEELYPEIAQTLNSSTDYYSAKKTAYTMIKKLGIAVEDNYSADRELAKVNSLKPRPLNAVSPQKGDNPLAHANAFANGLTPELKRQLLDEMNESIKYL